MPIYEYVCNECGHALDALQKISDAPLRLCPACNKESLKKKISAPGFRLSGSGWYETDFKSDKQKNVLKKDGADSADSGKKDKPADSGKKDKPADGGSAKSGGKEAAA